MPEPTSRELGALIESLLSEGERVMSEPSDEHGPVSRLLWIVVRLLALATTAAIEVETRSRTRWPF